MPTSLESLATLWTALERLGPTKTHLFRAGREILLAGQSLIGIIEDYFKTVPLSAEKKVLSDFVLGSVQRVIQTLVSSLGNGVDQETSTIHNRVLDSIIGVINEELGRLATASRSTPADRLKLQALTSIRETLERQRKKGGDEGRAERAPSAPAKRGPYASRNRHQKNAHR